MTRLRRGLWATVGVVLLVVVGLVIVQVTSHWLEGRAWAQFEEERGGDRPVRIADLGMMPPELPETSGLAVSRDHPGVLWSHNDSGDEPVLYRLDTTAALTAAYGVAGAQAVDWESMDIGPCPVGTGDGLDVDCLFVGDVGDNEERRAHVTIYIVMEPDPGEEARTLPLAGRVRYRYPTAPYDVEAVAVDTDGDVAIVTKGRTGEVLLFELSAADVADAVARDEIVELGRGTPLPIEPDWNLGRMTTGASISAGGDLLAVRTYSEIYFFGWPLRPAAEPTAEPCFLGETEPQGEAVAFWTAGRLLLTSESWTERAGHLLAVVCPAMAENAPQ